MGSKFIAYVKRLEQAFILHNVMEEKEAPAIISCKGP